MTDFWTPERVEKLTHWWNVEGLSANAIAERWGVTSNTISGKVDRLNLKPRKAPPVCWATRERVIREVQANDGTAADAARILGVGMDTILKSSAKLGLRFPPRNGYGVLTAQRRLGAVKPPKSPPCDCKSVPGARQAPVAVTAPPPPENTITLRQLRDGVTRADGTYVPGTCKWPYGDEPPFTFCGHATVRGKRWCGYHNAQATVRQ